MRALTVFCIASLALVVCSTVTEARRHHGRHSRKQEEEQVPEVSQVQQEEPKPVPIVSIAESEEAPAVSEEKPRPIRQRKAPVLCNANTAQANVDKADKQETTGSSSFEIITPNDSVESVELPSSEEVPNIETPVVQPKPVKKPKGKVVPASSEESEELDENDDSQSDEVSAAIASIEESAPPKALENSEIPDESSRAVESEEEKPKPKARRSKHNRQDVRKIERPHRRRVVFRSSDEDDE